jgi:hypothetical protein
MIKGINFINITHESHVFRPYGSLNVNNIDGYIAV